MFADLGLPDAEELEAKALLVIEIIQIIETRGVKQAEAAEIMGIDQPKVSQLMRGKLDGFSMERLYRFLNALGRDIEIAVKPKPRTGYPPVVRETVSLYRAKTNLSAVALASRHLAV